jgi:2-amino-4-hydroxy-6-hydroxymethyldihydropteridine diphosphokinase
MVRAYIGVGSNVGDPRRQVAGAIEALRDLGRVRSSSLYRTEPLGSVPQPWYVNAVAELSTDLDPAALLSALQALEKKAGRRRGERWGPRSLDLDLLLYGDASLDRADLVIPHPEFSRRRFVLEPLAELAPDLIDPRSGRSMQELLAGLDDPLRVEKLPGPGPTAGAGGHVP